MSHTFFGIFLQQGGEKEVEQIIRKVFYVL